MIYCAGGHFLILAPITARNKVNDLRKEISKILFDTFNGRLYLAIETVSLSPEDFLIKQNAEKSGFVAKLDILSQNSK